MSVVSKRGSAVTIKDVARAAGVGLMTVSRVINGVPGNKFSQETALRVREAIDQLGYVPNHVARSLRGRKSGVIGVVTTSVSDPFWASCARGVELEARKQNYVPILVATDEDCLLEERQVAALQAHRVDGLLLVSTYRAHRTSLINRLANIPTVAIDRPISGFKTDCVLIDNHHAAYGATRHLLSHGHRRMAFIGYGEKLYTVRERIEGYTQAMNEAGFESVVLATAHDSIGARLLAHEALSRKDAPSAIFASNTLVIHGILQAASDLGLSIPDDLALAGFEDFRWAGLVKPGLTVVRQPGEEMGRLGAQMLFERLGGKKGPPQRVMLDTELVIRESCGCGTRAALTAVPA
ncbi:MAG TPA: LacI family DNA-binding transcriptional regulator [Bryobacteraceae bacterium]|jgi:LacI family transcriptional regulator